MVSGLRIKRTDTEVRVRTNAGSQMLDTNKNLS